MSDEKVKWSANALAKEFLLKKRSYQIKDVTFYGLLQQRKSILGLPSLTEVIKETSPGTPKNIARKDLGAISLLRLKNHYMLQTE